MLQRSICSLSLLMNLAILWDLLIQTSVELWCTLSTLIRTQKPSDFLQTTGEEFRSYTVNSRNLIFKTKPTRVQVSLSLIALIARASPITKKKKMNKLGENKLLRTLSTHCVPSVTCSHRNQEVTKLQCMAWCSVLPHTCILPSKSCGPCSADGLFQWGVLLAQKERYCATHQVQ